MRPWTFDAQKHEFRLHGEVIPSVTQLLKSAGYIDTRWYTPAARDRGTDAHAAIEAADTGERLIAGSPSTAAYARSYKCLRLALGFIPMTVETPHVNIQRRFGGIIDLIVLIDGEEWLLELKTGAPQPWHSIQTALQAILWGMRPTAIKRGAVYLKQGGIAVLRPHEDLNDFTEAEICLLEVK